MVKDIKITLTGKKVKAKANVKKKNKFSFITKSFAEPTPEEALQKAHDDERKKAEKERLKQYRKAQLEAKTAKKNSQKNSESIAVLKRRIFKEVSSRIKSEFNAAAISVYFYRSDSSENIQRIYGADIENKITIERYCSFSNTIILVSPTGIEENKTFKSRLITRFIANDITYMVSISSYAMETFKGKNSFYILQLLKNMQERLGEIDEYSTVMRQKNKKKI